MVFGGTSVSAGHDNLFNQSFPLIFEKRVRKIFQELKIDFIVDNVAQGQSDCLPYELCYETQGGFNVDVYGW